MYDPIDSRNIPVSAGIPRVIYVSAIVGIIMIFTMLSLVFRSSAEQHVWPASQTLTVPLKK